MLQCLLPLTGNVNIGPFSFDELLEVGTSSVTNCLGPPPLILEEGLACGGRFLREVCFTSCFLFDSGVGLSFIDLWLDTLKDVLSLDSFSLKRMGLFWQITRPRHTGSSRQALYKVRVWKRLEPSVMFWWEALCVVKPLSFRVQILWRLMLPSDRLTPLLILNLRFFFIEINWFWRSKTRLNPIAFKCTYFCFWRNPSFITSANLFEHELIIILFIARGCSCSRESINLVC